MHLTRRPFRLELDRLVELYRNNGYFRFSREELVGVWDTLDVSFFLQHSTCFEQLEALQKSERAERKSKSQPGNQVETRIDTAKSRKYYRRNISVYPDYQSRILLGRTQERSYGEWGESNLLSQSVQANDSSGKYLFPSR